MSVGVTVSTSDTEADSEISARVTAFLSDEADLSLEISLCHWVDSWVQMSDTGRECDYKYKSRDLLCLKTVSHLSISVSVCYESLLTIHT